MISSKKRTRPFPSKSGDKSVNNKRQKQTIPRGTKTVKLDELAWSNVEMPDRLDDVEGFFGLEEIDGVDVVVENGGVKMFKVNEDDLPKVIKKSKADQGNEKIEESENESEHDEGEEWGGITSDHEGAEAEKVETPEASKPAKTTNKKKKQQTSKLDSTLANVDFSALNEAEEEDTPLPDWDPLELSQPILRALSKLSFTTPTPIQAAAIPLIIANHDVIGKAATGSGKTLAFGIPILERFLASLPTETTNEAVTAEQRRERQLTALIISPTRELAHQISKHLTDLAQFTDMRTVTITGGLSLQKQVRLLENGVDVIVATPGRLWEVVSEGHGWIEKLRNAKMLVIDEADRVLEAGHFKEVEQILKLMDAREGESSDEEEDEEEVKAKVFGNDNVIKKAKRKQQQKKKRLAKGGGRRSDRQTMVFSATFHKGLQQKLAGKSAKRDWAESGELLGDKESMAYLLKKLNFRDDKPKWVDVNPMKTVSEKVKEGLVECGAMEKDLYLYYLLLRYPYRTLVFTNSISSVRRLVPFLNQLVQPPQTTNAPPENATRAYPLHSQMAQKARLRSLERFANPAAKSAILVATDVAARGLDIKNVELVIHYHLPRTADMYVHRSGRTARGNEQAGVSMVLCAPGEALAMTRLIGKVHADATSQNAKGKVIKSLDVDRKIVALLKRRVELAKNISDSEQENQKQGKEEEWLRTAAEDLGLDVSDSEIAIISGRGKKGKSRDKGKGKGGRGVEWDDDLADAGDAEQGRKMVKARSKEEVTKWKMELWKELSKQINKGFSTKYLTSGEINLAEHLLNGKNHGGILGEVNNKVVEEMR